MKCPHCRASTTEVYNSRTTKFGNQIWRRRRCQNCHESFTTYEAADLGFLKVASNSGRPVRYSRARLYDDLATAFPAAPSQDTLDALTDTIESKLLDLQKPTLSTAEIARLVLSTLKHFNTAAFVRYLTTHAELANPSQLTRELKKY